MTGRIAIAALLLALTACAATLRVDSDFDPAANFARRVGRRVDDIVVRLIHRALPFDVGRPVERTVGLREVRRALRDCGGIEP